MIPAAFDYERATSLDEALDLLAQHGSDAKVIAGGQSLLPLMKLRLARPERLIDIARLGELRGVREAPSESRGSAGRGSAGRGSAGLAIGALTTYAELLADPTIGRFGVFADALPRIGDVQVRNRGTIGGSIAHADPAADLPAVLLALDAAVVVRSAARGEREIAINEFLQSAFTTALAEDELLTEIRLPAPSGSAGSAYEALAQQASGYPIAGVAVVLGDIVRVAVTGIGERAYRAAGVEANLASVPAAGAALTDAALDGIVASVTDGIDVNGDLHADPEYRAAMAQVMAKRAIARARARLG
jgi:aerobic carbon-monoxide dehydrogenase medium subunit